MTQTWSRCLTHRGRHGDCYDCGDDAGSCAARPRSHARAERESVKAAKPVVKNENTPAKLPCREPKSAGLFAFFCNVRWQRILLAQNQIIQQNVEDVLFALDRLESLSLTNGQVYSALGKTIYSPQATRAVEIGESIFRISIYPVPG